MTPTNQSEIVQGTSQSTSRRVSEESEAGTNADAENVREASTRTDYGEAKWFVREESGKKAWGVQGCGCGKAM